MNQGQEPFAQVFLGLVQAEFVALRAEIGRLIDHQKDLQNLSLVSLGAVFAFVAAISELDSEGNDIAVVLLLVPFLTLQFALTASDLSRRIRDLASYIEGLSGVVNDLVERVEPQLGDLKVWQWEAWKRARFSRRKSQNSESLTAFHGHDGASRTHAKEKPSKLRPAWLVVTVDKAKWLSLLLPGLVSTVGYFVIDEAPTSSGWKVAASVVGIAILVASAALLTMYKSEATGIAPGPEVRLGVR